LGGDRAARRRAARIAFGDRPGDEPPAADDPTTRWLAAVALGARGRYAAAAALLLDLLADRSVPNALRAHAAVTRGAHLRQLGGHAAARRWDGLGLALATPARAPSPVTDRWGADHPRDRDDAVAIGADLLAARTDALLGLAADALGLGRLDLAERLLGAAEPLATAHISWRPGVRWRWVRAELALCRDRPTDAERPAREALEVALAAGAIRHEIKSRIVLAAIRVATRVGVTHLLAELAELSERTRQIGLYTLEWPIQLLVAELSTPMDEPDARAHRRRAERTVTLIRSWSDPAGRSVLDRSPYVPRRSQHELTQ
jgi:hypothetical protein